jgi:hypothetical protein
MMTQTILPIWATFLILTALVAGVLYYLSITDPLKKAERDLIKAERQKEEEDFKERIY